MNLQIRIPEVQIIDAEGKFIGKMPTEQALRQAKEQELDLVEVNPRANPPICKIIDWGSYLYQQEKAERKQKAKMKVSEIKGIRLSLKIGAHDLDMRRSQSLKFFEQGDRVKLEMILRGREKARMDLARQIMKDFVTSLGEGVVVDSPMSSMGGRLTALIRRKK
ncbi:MAG: translation initiation factor IF-3 [Patescibacteria group bacterium]